VCKLKFQFMDLLLAFLAAHAAYAHWIVFGALLLSGFNLPISEDLLIIWSALTAALVVPENWPKLYAAVFIGCFCSDSIAYAIGRVFGPKLWSFAWFSKRIDRKRLDQIQNYYAKYGFLTLWIGRFIPFGVRNCLLLAAGLGKMHYGRFLLSDGLACLCSNTALFALAFFCSKNSEALLSGLRLGNFFLFGAFVVSVIAFVWYKRKKKVSDQGS
jgi:membrane-associated protein